MSDKQKVQCGLTEITMSAESGKAIINGCITLIESASDGAPCGADGHKIMFSKESIDKCAQSYVGMPINASIPDEWFGEYTDLLTGHSDINIGYIRSVEAVDNKLMAEMVLWKDKYPELSFMVVNTADSLGFSIECYVINSHDSEEITVVDEFEGAGCALLFKKCAAFEGTFIEKIAANKKRGVKKMEEKDLQKIVEEVSNGVKASLDEKFGAIEEKIAKVEASNEELKAQIEQKDSEIAELKAQAEKVEAEHQQKVAELKASAEEVKAQAEPEPQKAIPQPTAVQASVENPLNAENEEVDMDKKIAEIHASDMSAEDKMHAIFKIRHEQH